jgi:hypothetical protein
MKSLNSTSGTIKGNTQFSNACISEQKGNKSVSRNFCFSIVRVKSIEVSRSALMDRMLYQCVKVPRYLCLNLQVNIAMIPIPNGDGTELVTSLAHKVSKILLVALKCPDITTI